MRYAARVKEGLKLMWTTTRRVVRWRRLRPVAFTTSRLAEAEARGREAVHDPDRDESERVRLR